MSDDEALALFRQLRWGEGEQVVCPHCGMAHRHYFRPTRKIWRCAGCQDDFSVTSGTIFAFHKLPLRLYLAAAILFTNAVKGISALQVGRDLGVSHKTAYVLLHKIRESLLVGRDECALSGAVHVDGAYVGGKVRPENRKEDRVDRRLAENQDPDKRCILVMRQAHSEAEVAAGNVGARKTLTFIVKNENQTDIGKLAPAYIAKGSVICADESDAYDLLHARYAVRRVNHSQEFRADDGTTNNLAESYVSRFRRFHIGQVHKVAPKYLDNYANEMAYQEDTRRWSNGDIFRDIVGKCARDPGEPGLLRVLAGQPPAGGNPGGVKRSGDRPGGTVSVTAGKDQGAATLQATQHANGVLPHLLDHDGGRFQSPAGRQRLADLAAAQRRTLGLAEDVENHALAFARPEEAVPYPMGLDPDRPQVDFRGKQLAGRVEVGQIIRQASHFLPVVLDQPRQIRALGDQGRNGKALCHEKCSRAVKTRGFASSRGSSAGGGCSIMPLFRLYCLSEPDDGIFWGSGVAPLSESHGQGGETTAGVHRAGGRPVRDRVDAGRAPEDLLHHHTHLHPSQRSAWADVDSRAI
jgi:transposase-like protein